IGCAMLALRPGLVSAQSRVDVSVVTDLLFVGEFPTAVIKVTAPKDRGVRVIRQDKLIEPELIYGEVVDADGKPGTNYNSGAGPFPRVFPAEDFMDVPAGQSATVTRIIPSFGNKPGP